MSRKLMSIFTVCIVLCLTISGVVAESKPDAAGIVRSLQEAGLPIQEMFVFTAKNDPNSLLGRPNQYVGKVSFIDSRIGSLVENPIDIEVADGGSLELFANEEDAEARYNYVSAITKIMPMLAEYGYRWGNAYLRLSRELTPQQAKEYEIICANILGFSEVQASEGKENQAMSADSLLKGLLDEGLPITQMVIFTTETDPNKLLGRPNQYKEKASFVDSRIQETVVDLMDINVSDGGSIEIFENRADAKARYEYVSGMVSLIFGEYRYLVDTVFLRLSKDFTPDQAKLYEEALSRILD